MWNYKIAMAISLTSQCQGGDEVLKCHEWWKTLADQTVICSLYTVSSKAVFYIPSEIKITPLLNFNYHEE